MNNQEIRSIILRKFYNDSQEKPRHVFGFNEFITMGFTEKQIDFNAKYLHEKGLLEVQWSLGEIIPSFAQITAYGIDVVEDPETTGRQLPFVQNNIQIIKGNINHSIVAQSARQQIMNISESFNEIYNQIDESENIDISSKDELKEEIKEIEEHLNEGNIDLDWIKEKSLRIKEKAHWVSPILQNIITEAAKNYLGF